MISRYKSTVSFCVCFTQLPSIISYMTIVWWCIPIIPALWEAEAGRSLEVSSLSSAWPTWLNPVFTKNTKISWAWLHMHIIPATQEAKAGESLKLRSETLSQKTKQNKAKKLKKTMTIIKRLINGGKKFPSKEKLIRHFHVSLPTPQDYSPFSVPAACGEA